MNPPRHITAFQLSQAEGINGNCRGIFVSGGPMPGQPRGQRNEFLYLANQLFDLAFQKPGLTLSMPENGKPWFSVGYCLYVVSWESGEAKMTWTRMMELGFKKYGCGICGRKTRLIPESYKCRNCEKKIVCETSSPDREFFNMLVSEPERVELHRQLEVILDSECDIAIEMAEVSIDNATAFLNGLTAHPKTTRRQLRLVKK